LVGMPAVASASTSRASSVTPFGVLGPVGLVAVSLGILGMVAGVLRQRKRSALARSAVAGVAVTAVHEPVDSVAVSSTLPKPTLVKPQEALLSAAPSRE